MRARGEIGRALREEASLLPLFRRKPGSIPPGGTVHQEIAMTYPPMNRSCVRAMGPGFRREIEKLRGKGILSQALRCVRLSGGAAGVTLSSTNHSLEPFAKVDSNLPGI
jgi:hypothetical protein